MFCDMCKVYEVQMSLSINKVLLEPSHTHSFPYRLWLISPHNGRVESLQQTLCGLECLLSGSSQKSLLTPVWRKIEN